MKAGESYVCVVCDETHPEGSDHFDAQLNGPCCPECKGNVRWATAWMKKEGIDRPMEKKDINTSNHKRFIIP